MEKTIHAKCLTKQFAARCIVTPWQPKLALFVFLLQFNKKKSKQNCNKNAHIYFLNSKFNC